MRTQVGEYDILEELGTGSTGVVYLAQHQLMDRRVAIKVVNHQRHAQASPATQQRLRDHLLAEADKVRRFKHESIASIYDVRLIDGEAYVMYEWIDGLNLASWITENVPTPEQIETISVRLAKALEYAHREDVIHCDIKPQNILMRADDDPVIVDFGVAATIPPGQDRVSPKGRTLRYASPEQTKDGKVDCRADIYSLGMVVRDLLTCCLEASSQQHDRADRIRIHRLNALCSQMTESDLELRTKSMSEVVDVLRKDSSIRYRLLGIGAILGILLAFAFFTQRNDRNALLNKQGAVQALPNTPQKITASAVGTDAILIKWDSAIEVGDYFLERACEPEAFKQIAILSQDDLQYLDEGNHLTENTTYRYRVRACTEHVFSKYSGQCKVNTQSRTPTPTGLYCEPVSERTVQIRWTTDAKAGAYFLERSLKLTTEYKQISIEPADSGRYLDTGEHLIPGAKYYYRLRTKTDGVFSNYTDPVHLELPHREAVKSE
ncbi:MAG: protein kinase [Rubripirellula sp.]